MTIYSFWIFDRHCNCVYAKDWQRQRASRRPASFAGSSSSPAATTSASLATSYNAADPSSDHYSSGAPGDFVYRRGLAPLYVDANVLQPPGPAAHVPQQQLKKQLPPNHHALFDSELGKLVFGVVFSLRNTVRKLTDGADDAFATFSTSKYKLHFFETPSNVRFVLVSDQSMDSQVHVLKYIYANMYVEYAAKNPLYPVDPVNSAVLANDLLVLGIESYISSLPNFE